MKDNQNELNADVESKHARAANVVTFLRRSKCSTHRMVCSLWFGQNVYILAHAIFLSITYERTLWPVVSFKKL